MIARNMVNEPANVMTPTSMSEVARRVAEDNGLGFEVMDNADMREMGMGAFIGVAQGSEEPAKLIILTYDGDPDNPGNNLGLIGKGITFDTGGISLKPRGEHGGNEGRYGRRRVGNRGHADHRPAQAPHQRYRHGGRHREHARRFRPAPRRRGHRH